MRIRLRGPSGSSAITVEESSTVGDLLKLISEATAISQFDIKIGYPPRPLKLESYSKQDPLSVIDVRLGGEQLIISPKEKHKAEDVETRAAAQALPRGKPPSTDSSFSFADVPGSAVREAEGQSSVKATRPAGLTRKSHDDIERQPPEIPVPDHSATMVLRIMPDDNSCLFRAFGTAFMGSMDSMTELRSLVAQNIQEHPELYTEAVLEQPVDRYCEWIQTEYSWGGGIELSILSTHFDIEICSVDVQSLRVDRFNEGRPTRCILVYSGIHYDTIVISPSSPPHLRTDSPPEFDIKVFDSKDETLLEKAVELCRILQGKHYFTDTASFSVRCNVCGAQLTGEKGASEHASKTGHYDFGEAE